jgi:hypothetical protein
VAIKIPDFGILMPGYSSFDQPTIFNFPANDTNDIRPNCRKMIPGMFYPLGILRNALRQTLCNQHIIYKNIKKFKKMARKYLSAAQLDGFKRYKVVIFVSKIFNKKNAFTNFYQFIAYVVFL